MNPNLSAALAYVAKGWPVFPCEPSGKAPLGRLVPHGFHQATADIEHVQWWWAQEPNANIAIPTGPRTVDVLDVDVTENGSGFPYLNQAKRAGLIPEPYALVRTPRGGAHLYYSGSEQGCGRLVQQHIDLKSAGGYVLVPPSVVDGKPYVLVHTATTAGVLNWRSLVELFNPPRPISSSRKPTTTGTGIPGLAAWLAGQTEGNRNSGLFWACCRAVENGATEHDLEELVRVAISINLDEREARRTVRSALRNARRSA